MLLAQVATLFLILGPYRGFAVDPPCGKRPSGSRIVNGQEAVPHSWPWQASLRKGSSNYHTCGATLIRPGWAVTAAHCVMYPRKYTVVVGSHFRDASSASVQNIKVKRVYRHKGFSMAKYVDDLALLQLERPAVLNDQVTTACLPNGDPKVGSVCYITGWGRLSSMGDVALTLQQAKVPIASGDDCKKAYGSIIKPYSHICVGYNTEGAASTCQGDSGGPLVCEEGGRWVLHGATSFGKGCSPNHYSVFTRVNSYLKWIYDHIGEDGGRPTPAPTPSQTPSVTRPTTREVTLKPTTARPTTKPTPVPPQTNKPTDKPTRPPATTSPPQGCKDQASNCGQLQSYCLRFPIVKARCPKTCKTC